MKEYSTFPKSTRLESHHQIVSCYILDTHCGGEGSYSSAEMQSVYSTAPTDWAREREGRGGWNLYRKLNKAE